jgi:ATP-dependent Clp protease ATP-binding subunit ClpA
MVPLALVKVKAKPTSDPLLSMMERRLIGQSAAIRTIVPYVELFEANLAPEQRPVGTFLLLGPTGTGKTKTAETLAECLHGSSKKLIRIDCGEFQSEQETAKLIGAPPGYLGHRDTTPRFNQANLNGSTSDHSKLSIVLIDEIEKASDGVRKLLLGVLDRAVLVLGDNTVVDFQSSLIFMTSNLGSKEMESYMKPVFGFRQGGLDSRSTERMQQIGMRAVRKQFAPEFVNRIDSVIAYLPLSAAMIADILELEIAEMQRHINHRLNAGAFNLEVSKAAREFLIAGGTSIESGARELKRTIHRCLLQPLTGLLNAGRILPGVTVWVGAELHALKFRIRSS